MGLTMSKVSTMEEDKFKFMGLGKGQFRGLKGNSCTLWTYLLTRSIYRRKPKAKKRTTVGEGVLEEVADGVGKEDG